MKSACAFAPANISCIFTVQKSNNPRWMGSTGLGFTLDKGVIVEVLKLKKTEVFFNNKKIKFSAVETVIKSLTKEPICVNIVSELPLGYGFGLSGASALASAYAINKLLGLKKTKKELAVIAHTAEVKNKTGLGDVVNEYFGGFCLKVKPSSYFSIRRIPLKEKYVYIKYFSTLFTKSVLENKSLIRNVNIYGDNSIKKIRQLIKEKKKITLAEIIEVSKEFVTNCGLLRNKKTKSTIKQIEKNNGYASMIILGNAVFSNVPFPGSQRFSIGEKKADII